MTFTWIFMNHYTLEYLAIRENQLTDAMRWNIELNGFELYSDVCTINVTQYMKINEPNAKKTDYVLKSVKFATAKEFVQKNHRHHKAPQGHKFSIGLFISNQLVGVVIVGRPVSRILDDNETLEITRCCILEGYPNAISKLYSAVIQAARSLFYKRIITYTLTEEIGSSMRAAGFKLDKITEGGSWNCESRPRLDKAPLIPKYRWSKRIV